MRKLMRSFRRFAKGEEGATIVEYGILVALLSVVSILVIASVGLYVKGAFLAVETEMGTAGVQKAP